MRELGCCQFGIYIPCGSFPLIPLTEKSYQQTNKQPVKETKIAEEVEVVLTEVFFCELQAKPLVFYQLEYLDMFLQGQE